MALYVHAGTRKQIGSTSLAANIRGTKGQEKPRPGHSLGGAAGHRFPAVGQEDKISPHKSAPLERMISRYHRPLSFSVRSPVA